LQEAFGIRDESVFKAAGGLHGGIGGSGDVCGSLLGASLMPGLMFGRGTDEEIFPPGDKKDPTRMVGELYQWFKKEFGTVKCFDLRDKYEEEVALDPSSKGLSDRERMMRTMAKCDEMAARTAARAAEILCDSMEPGPD
jgi:C_GCAxxG_C_C family probable redox protein